MALEKWIEPAGTSPCEAHKGEASRDPLYTAVGRALSAWEHAETGFLRLFQLFCETRSHAACRAYGMLTGSSSRAQSVLAAAEQFFSNRSEQVPKEVTALVNAYNYASAFRNKIAHGLVAGMMDKDGQRRGYYLSAPSYTARSRTVSKASEFWWLSAKYYYRVSEIDHCTDRFTCLLAEAMRLIADLNNRYEVLEPGEFHP